MITFFARVLVVSLEIFNILAITLSLVLRSVAIGDIALSVSCKLSSVSKLSVFGYSSTSSPS